MLLGLSENYGNFKLDIPKYPNLPTKSREILFDGFIQISHKKNTRDFVNLYCLMEWLNKTVINKFKLKLLFYAKSDYVSGKISLMLE